MQRLILSIFFLALVTVAVCKKVKYWGTDEERNAIIDEALSEARLSAAMREKAFLASIDESKPISASMKLARGFKKASRRAQQAGKARIFMEDVVKRAEAKLFDLRMKLKSEGSEALGEEIVEQRFYQPGYFLKEEEIARLYEGSGCDYERDIPANCSDAAQLQYRTIDGTCNNLVSVMDGASETALRRISPPVYEDGISSPRGSSQASSTPYSSPHPSSRLVSLNVIRDTGAVEAPHSLMLMQFGQFLDHDIDLSPELGAECLGCTMSDVCQNILVPEDDPMFGLGTERNGECLPFRRSLAVCATVRPGSFEARQQMNAITSFIDGSAVYGSTIEVENVLRLFRDGLLRSGPPAGHGQKETLPTIRSLANQGVVYSQDVVSCPTEDGDDCFACGDVRCNEQISLTIMHTIWMREHNRIAEQLLSMNPHWNDERIYQEARAIVGAELQRVAYFEYLPTLLGPQVFKKVIKKYENYDYKVDPSIPNAFSTAAYRYGHSLIQESFQRLDENYQPLPMGPLYLADAFFNPPNFEKSGGTDPILRGLVSSYSGRIDEFLTTQLTNQLFENTQIPGSGMDLAALNIQRARDHGLPSYTTVKKFCKRAFPELKSTDIENELTYIRLLQTYGSLDSVELWVGGLAEERANNALVGATIACLLGLGFANVRDGDRFYFENKNNSFTQGQRSAIRKTSLSGILCDNGDNIEEIQPNAFLMNQDRVRCENIERLSLDKWEEKVYYFRLGMSDPNLVVASYSYSAEYPQAMSINSNEKRSICLPFSCQGEKESVVIVVPRLSPDGHKMCTISPNMLLQEMSYTPTTSFFEANFCPSSMFAENSGIYDSLADCQAGSVTAFTFDEFCQPPLKSQTISCATNSVENPNCPGYLPQEVKEILRDDYGEGF